MVYNTRPPPPPSPHSHTLSVYTVFGSAQTEWGHLANPQLAWHSYRHEPVARRAVALHSSHPNASMKEYECGSTQPLL
jgi:hypothetical protein